MRKGFLILLCAAAAGVAGRVDFGGPLLKAHDWLEPSGPTLKSYEWVEPPGVLESPSLQDQEPTLPFLESFALLDSPMRFAALEAPPTSSSIPEPSGWFLMAVGISVLLLAAVPRRILLMRSKRKLRYDG